MWIEKTNNKYRMCERYVDFTGKRSRASVTMPKNTPKEREKARQKLDNIILANSSAPDVDVTLERLIALYEKNQKQTVKQSTAARNASCCRQFKKLLGKDVDVNKLTAGYVKAKFMEHSDSPTKINEYIARFKALIRWGYQNDFVESAAWLDKLTRLKDKSKKEKVKDKYLERAECKKLLAAMTHEDWHNLTELLILSGMRIGEALALTEDDIDFTAKTISVTKNYNPTFDLTDTPKTPASVRDIHMTPALIALTRSVIASNRRKRTVLYLDGSPLFFDLQGRHAHYDAYRKYLGETSERVLGRRVTPHVLRHTHASLLAEQGMTIEEIKDRLGHDNSRVTQEIYVHVTEKRRQTTNKKLDKIKII